MSKGSIKLLALAFYISLIISIPLIAVEGEVK
jgi:hypothetical protein